MPLDRQDIEKKDFPVARRGYEPDAVDAHLRAIADRVEELRRQPPSAASLASDASDQVRSIIEAAEKTAADIRRRAEEEADQARTGADTEAQNRLSQVEEATKVMLQRLEEMESELGSLLESLRTGANRLTAELSLLQGSVGELRATPAAAAEPEEGRAPTVEAPAAEEPEEGKAPTVEAPAEEAATPPADDEGARLIALNMALNGTPRGETERYLAENFQLDDRDALLDEVYARVG